MAKLEREHSMSLKATEWARAQPLDGRVFAVFFAALLWRIPGAFMGVPLAIAVLTLLEQYTSTAWIAELLSGTPAHSRPIQTDR
jgi:hypothetical protein